MPFLRYLVACGKEVLKGGKLYWAWLLSLGVVAIVGIVAYAGQIDRGLIVTGMSDQVSWGIYIANFTFLVGLAAAAVMLVVPAYIFHKKEAKTVVLLAEGVAVAACIMCMLFVTADLGHPERFWHLLPGVGRFNFPRSILAWDVLVLAGYLFLNLSIPLYFLFMKYRGKPANWFIFFPGVLISIFWAISIHTVTAFLYSANTGRPFWHSALLAPRFIASAFTAGPAFMVLAFRVISSRTSFKVEPRTLNLLALIAAIALQANLFMLGSELFTEFYAPTSHSASAAYLFFGLDGDHSLVPWIYTALSLEFIALLILIIHPLRQNFVFLATACTFAIVGIWIEKGMGLVIPGFVPTPQGEVFGYLPTLTETLVSLGIWAIGLMVFTVLAKAAIAIQTGKIRDTVRKPASA